VLPAFSVDHTCQIRTLTTTLTLRHRGRRNTLTAPDVAYNALREKGGAFMVSNANFLQFNGLIDRPASKSIPIGTVVEISPVLLFTKPEYDEHGW